MEPPIRNKPPIRNTFAADRVIFRIGVFTVLGNIRYAYIILHVALKFLVYNIEWDKNSFRMGNFRAF